MNGTEELWKKHHGCLRPIMLDIEYDINKNLKDKREYIKEMQSWGEMHKVVDEFIELAIDNDETW